MSEKKDKTENPATPAEEQKPSELEKAKNDYLYLLAEFDNYRKNAIKERSELMKYGSERLIREFLGILDNFERALETSANGEAGGAFREGIQMIFRDLQSMLQKHGVEEVKAEGLPFDPAVHEALSSEPRSDLEPGHVARVFKKAYKMHDKILRPAQVTVSVAAENKS